MASIRQICSLGITLGLKLVFSVLVVVVGIGFTAWASPAVANHDCGDPKWANHPHCAGGGGGGDGDGGKDQMAANFDDSVAGIQSDSIPPSVSLYVNKEPGVDVFVGGAARGIRIDLNSDGSQGDRFFMVDADCADDPPACPEGDISGDFPTADTDEYAILDVFHVSDMPADGNFYPKHATFQISQVLSNVAAGIATLQFRFREPELFNSGGACSNEGGSIGAGTAVWVARSENAEGVSTWEVTTADPGDPFLLGSGITLNDAGGGIACLEVLTSATNIEFGGNYNLSFAVTVGPESVIAP